MNEPKFRIDDTFVWCDKHPLTKYNYRLYPDCFDCKEERDREEVRHNNE
jgi:hypothetical protein